LTLEPATAGLRGASVPELRAALAFLRSPAFLVDFDARRPSVSSGPPHGLTIDDGPAAERPRVDRVSEVANTVARIVERSLRLAAVVDLRGGPEPASPAADRIVLQLAGEATVGAAVLAPGATAYVSGSERLPAAAEGGGCRLVVTLEALTDAEFRTWLAATLRAPGSPVARVPLHAPPGERADFVAAVRSDFAGALASPSILERFLAYRDRRAPARPPLGGASRLTDPSAQSVVVCATRDVHVTLESAEQVRVDAGGVSLQMPLAAGLILRFVQDRDQVAVAGVEREFAERLPAGEIHAFLQDLANQQVVAFTSAWPP
jgi:hypothetical protein